MGDGLYAPNTGSGLSCNSISVPEPPFSENDAIHTNLAPEILGLGERMFHNNSIGAPESFVNGDSSDDMQAKSTQHIAQTDTTTKTVYSWVNGGDESTAPIIINEPESEFNETQIRDGRISRNSNRQSLVDVNKLSQEQIDTSVSTTNTTNATSAPTLATETTDSSPKAEEKLLHRHLDKGDQNRLVAKDIGSLSCTTPPRPTHCYSPNQFQCITPPNRMTKTDTKPPKAPQKKKRRIMQSC